MAIKMLEYVLFLLVLPELHLCGSPCPNSVEIYPCTCKKESRATLVACRFENANDAKIPMAAMRKSNMAIDELAFEGSDLENIGPDFFDGFQLIRSIIVIDSKIELSDGLFEGQKDNLAILRFKNVLIDYDSVLKMGSSLPDLESFEVSGSVFRTILSNFSDQFLTRDRLRGLVLAQDGISAIQKKAFVGFDSLRKLDLRRNLIMEFQDILPTSNRIVELLLRDNSLISFPKDIELIGSGGTVDLEKNHIREIDTKDLRNAVQKYMTVNLNRNELNCGRQFYMLTQHDNNIVGMCSQPEHLRGKRLQMLKPSDFKERVNE